MQRSRNSDDESGATASLELLALTPLLALLVLFVLWAGRSARAGLVADLAAEEAAVAAALCCDVAGPAADPDGTVAELRREYMAEAVLTSRPGLDSLCLWGPRPDSDRGFVTETEVNFAGAPTATGFAHGARVIEVHFDCETDGAVAPLRGLFSTVTMRGRASEVTVFADGPQLVVAPAIAVEGDQLVFVATLNEPTTDDIELTYFTRDRTATSRSETSEPSELDFDAIEEELSLIATLPTGATTAEMIVSTHDDTVCEGDETLVLVVSASGPTVPSTAGEDGVRFTTIATITDEDDCPKSPDP
ncbi:hypothetical protein [Candidatus Poriferisodalis sp.]|uniref:hypothetical protein n=1 Tax=Candidatus Poriferisodalis sp. TaxID=3101277 RepID=UPI003B02A2B0